MHGQSVAQLEILVRTVVFKSANALVGWLLQNAADRADASYQSQARQIRKGRTRFSVQGLFGTFPLERDYYYHVGKDQGHYPANAALGLEVGYMPALAKLICLEGADEPTYLKAERHLAQTGGITISARQIQRVVQRVRSSAQQWQARERPPGTSTAPVLYVSAACTAADAWKTFGNTGSANTPLATTPCRPQHKGRILSHTRWAPAAVATFTVFSFESGGLRSYLSRSARQFPLRTKEATALRIL